MQIPASAKLFELAGFMLADALVRASEAGEGRAFDPYAGIVRDGEFRMANFSPPTEENPDDGALALRYLLSHRDEFVAWALVEDTFAVTISEEDRRKGLTPADIDPNEVERIDTIAVRAWEEGMDAPFTVMQRYQPRRSGQFRIPGSPEFAYGGEFLTEEEVKEGRYIDLLRKGFMNHEEAANQWENWT